jgi:membrane fusion protein, multidrug efflux system
MIKKFISALSNPPQTISAAKAATSEWLPKVEAIGSLRAVKGADLSLEVSGVVESISFNSGDDVAEGAPLLKLRTADDVARLNSLQAMAELNDITYERDQKQFKMQAVSQATLDTDAANLKNAKAQVAQQQAIIDKKLLRASFAGHLGIRAVDLGQYLGPGTVIVTLQALDPIYVDFFVPQQSVDQVRLNQSVTIKIDAFKDQTFAGEIAAINPKVDTTNRNVQIRATLKNPDHKLLPGMYATVDIAVGSPTTYVTLPQTAITYNPYGDTVYVVEGKGNNADGKPQLTARQTFVTVGPTRGDQVAILKGVDEGDMIVTAGQIKLHNGSVVLIDNSVTPTADAAPVPVDR